MIVLDASALVELLLGGAAATLIERRIAAAGASLHAPHLIDVETLQAIRRHWLTGALSDARAETSLRRLDEARITRYPHAPLRTRIWELRQNVTAYDAAYIALAESLDAPLLTRDRRLAGATGHRATIELV